MSTIMQYSEDEAIKAGGSEYISEGGPYICQIKEAKYVTARTGTKGLEFTVKTQEGLQARFITAYYEKSNGEPVAGGVSLINAMMGLCQVQSISAKAGSDNGDYCPELTNKKIGLFLQKKLFTKNDGSDGYKFEIVVPFNPNDKRTMREISRNQDAKTIDRMAETYSDKDERGQNNSYQAPQSGESGFGGYPEAQGHQAPQGGFDELDDIPF